MLISRLKGAARRVPGEPWRATSPGPEGQSRGNGPYSAPASRSSGLVCPLITNVFVLFYSVL